LYKKNISLLWTGKVLSPQLTMKVTYFVHKRFGT